MESIERAGVVEVANDEGLEVEKKSEFDMERRVQAFEVRVPSESASCGPVEEAILSWKAGVVVPRPKLPVVPTKVNWFGTPALPKRMVEDAERPLVRSKSEEVEFALVPNDVVGVQANAAPLTRQLPAIAKHPAARLMPPVP